jgi:type 1 glutamine amidotransferase
MMTKKFFIVLTAISFVCTFGCSHKNEAVKALIVTGQNNHAWKVSHVAIKRILENSGLFAVDVAVSPAKGEDMSLFRPDFSAYELVVLDYNGDRWSKETDRAFLDYVGEGGGVVVFHAADNAFREWREFNEIIGFGGWEGRDETDGPYIYPDEEGVLVYDDSPGAGGSHGDQHEFVLHAGNAEHPIVKGLPARWLHAKDELYDRMRGPGKVKEVLFWAFSSPETGGSGRNELAVFTVDYGSARIFHTTLGHAGETEEDNTAMQCAGFQVTLLRGAEWAATGRVTQAVPADFPTETSVSLRRDYKE